MPTSSARPADNLLLAGLEAADLALLSASWEPVRLKVKDVVVHPNRPIEHVYFLTYGLASVISTASDGTRLEVGIFGRDGFSAPPLLLGADRTPQETFIQVEGAALKMDAAAFTRAVAQSASLRISLLRYVQVSTIQTAYTAISNGANTIEERLSRWLLMCHDRLDTDELPLTHEFLAMMLAVRRSGVTLAIQTLEGAGIVRARRGRVTVLDRGKLLQIADGSYGPAETEYERLIGPLRRREDPAAVARRG